MLNWVEYGKKFYGLGAWFRRDKTQKSEKGRSAYLTSFFRCWSHNLIEETELRLCVVQKNIEGRIPSGATWIWEATQYANWYNYKMDLY